MNFVLGFPRSGTSFMTQLLNNMSGDVICIHQNLMTLTGFEILEAAKRYYNHEASSAEIRQLVRCYNQRPQIAIDCNFILPLVLPVLLEEYPNARLVHLVRDPRENIRSVYNLYDFYGNLFLKPEAKDVLIRWHVSHNKPWLYPLFRDTSRCFPDLKRDDWGILSRLEKNCVYWSEHHRLALTSLSNHKYHMRVKLEDLVSDANHVMKVFDFLGLQAPSAEKIKGFLSTPLNASESAKWKEMERAKMQAGEEILPKFSNWSQSNKESLKLHCQEMAGVLGYEL